MKKISLLSLLILALMLTTLAACGGGGGGSSPSNGDSHGVTNPTKAVLTFSTAVTGTMPANTIITGYDLQFSLPAGVTVKSTTPPVTDAGVVTASGNAAGSSITAVYAPATAGVPGKVRILVASANGFPAGEFSKATCDIAAGTVPTTADFPQPTLAVSGYNTSTNTTVDLSGQISSTMQVSFR